MKRARGPAPDGSRPPHVVHATEAPLGGVVVYMDELLSRQIAAGMHVDLVTPDINLDALRAVVTGCGTVVDYPQPRRSAASLVRLAWRTIAHLRRVRPDILHVHSTFAGLVLRLCRPLLPRGTRVVYCPHGWAFSRVGSRLTPAIARVAERGLAPLSDRIVCISDHERREAERIGIAPGRLAVVENGIADRPVADTCRSGEGPLVIGFAGRLDRQKGFDTVVEVMRRLGPKARAVAIGSTITERRVAWDLPPNVECLGWQPREAVHAMLDDVDLLLMPSRWEGFGLVAAEAMQAGTPVFASRVGALADIVVDGETGRLFVPGDIDGIVAGIAGTPREALRRMGGAGRSRYLELYSAERMAQQMSDLYDEIRHR